jgi:hypothetical protein
MRGAARCDVTPGTAKIGEPSEESRPIQSQHASGPALWSTWLQKEAATSSAESRCLVLIQPAYNRRTGASMGEKDHAEVVFWAKTTCPYRTN